MGGYLEQLKEALMNPLLDLFEQGIVTPEVKHAVAEVAIALGYCRVFGVNTAGLGGVLSAEAALAAVDALEERISELALDTDALPEFWEGASPEDREAGCVNLIVRRMDLWVATTILGEAASEAIVDGDPRWGQLHGRIRELMADLDAVDRQLKQNIHLLSVLVNTPLMEWRQMLVEPYRSSAPYWLDGTLEEAAKEWQRRRF